MASIFSKIYYRIIGDLSVYYHAYGNHKKAKELCEKSVKNGGNSINALNFYGLLLLEDGDSSEALQCFTKAHQLNKNPVMEKRLAVNIGSCYWLMGQIDKAIDIIGALFDKYDYLNPDVYTTLGYLYLLKDDYDNALKYTEEALEQSGSHAPALDNLGQIYYKQGDFTQAEDNFKKALELNPSMTDSKYYLALINENRGDLDQAKLLIKSAHCDYVTALNTVSKKQIDEKYYFYFND